jgi:DNA-binding GntR family transcriptional regulator
VELGLRGLVAFDPTGHTRITTFTDEDVAEIYNIRLMIDPFAAALAAERADRKAFAAIQANIAAMKSAKKLADVTRLDTEFHDLVGRQPSAAPVLGIVPRPDLAVAGADAAAAPRGQARHAAGDGASAS